MREKKIEQSLREAVRDMGGRSYKFVSPGNRGVPDRLIVMPGGRIFFRELKAEDGEPDGFQRLQIARLQILGADASILTGRAEVEKFLRDIQTLQGGDAL